MNSDVISDNQAPGLPTLLVLLLPLSAGITVANIYYCQPLLATFASFFHASPGAGSTVAVATQAGYAAGLLFLTPLGDLYERKRLILLTTTLSAFSLLAVALSPSLQWMLYATFLTGMVTITPQLLVPYAVGLASPERCGRTVGMVVSGLLTGIIASRAVSGFIGEHAGWQAVYWAAAVVMFLLTAVLAITLPRQRPPQERPMRYLQVIGSLWRLLRREPVLRRHAVVGAFGFASFSTFWTALAFHLSSLPGRYGSETAGLFGLIGITGAFVAPFAGRVADRWDARKVNGGALFMVLASFAIMAVNGGGSLRILAIGVFLLDAGLQTSNISNQTRIQRLAPELRSRLNSVYMFISFCGATAGAALTTFCWTWGDWAAVCLLGGGLALGGIGALFTIGHAATGSP
jgi:predicted MFS family arabinose efflux permease